MTSTATTVVEAFSKVMSDVQAVRKDSVNTKQQFNFRGIDAVVNAVGPALREHGVVIVPFVESAHQRDVTVGQRGTPMREVTLKVRYVVRGPAGDQFEGCVVAEALDAGDKATAKAMSVAYRTFLLQALTIPTDDPDPDSHSYERSAPARPLLSPGSVARFVAACETARVDPHEVVKQATDGRTSDPAEVYADEADALRAVKAALTPEEPAP